jgi:HEAT repeat protein
MYNDDDLTVLEADLDDPLDQLAPLEDEAPKPDPELMLKLLDAEDVQQRVLATRAFCDLQYAPAIPRLMQLLTDTCPLVRVSAAYALGRNPSMAAVEPLIAQYHQDWNGYVRKGVVWALGNCQDDRALDTLIAALKHDISAVRLWAASSLAQMATLGYGIAIAAVPSLIESLRRDPVAAIRSNSAWALGQLCRELPSNVIYATAIDALIEAFAEDEDLSVREDAKSAMLKVGDARGLQVIEELEQEGFFDQ